MDETMDFEAMIATIKSGVEDMPATFDDPTDDWMPTAFVIDAEGLMTVVAIDPRFFSSQETKELLAGEVLPETIRKANGVAAAFLSSAWQAVMTANEMPPKLSPKHRPDRQEVVILSAATAFETKAYSAPIIRHEDKPPSLGEWQDFGDVTEGIFPAGLRAGLVNQG